MVEDQTDYDESGADSEGIPDTPSQVPEIYPTLLAYRERKDLKVRATSHLKDSFVAYDGEKRELRLRYYQIQGVLHLLAMPRFILGDDTGLGKTLQVIASLCFLWEREPNSKTVVVTSKSAVTQWSDEILRFTKGVKVFLCKGTSAKRAKCRDAFFASEGPSILVIGYGSLKQDFQYFQDMSGTNLVLDEATAFKNPKTQAHKICAYLSSQAQRVWGLTATLLKNELLEGFGIFKVIVPGLFPNEKWFLDAFCITKMMPLPGTRRKVPVVVGYTKGGIAEFKKMIDPYYYGRPKFEVASELPPLITSYVEVEMTEAQEQRYAEALSGLLTVYEKTESGSVQETSKEVTQLTQVIYCQQIVNHPGLIGCEGDSGKFDRLMDLLTDEYDGQKVIVYTRFKKMVDIISTYLTSKGVKNCRITGPDSDAKRKESQDLFQNVNSGVNVILITSAASEAINLQSAKALVFYDTPFSAGEYLQILGRMIRLGSKHDRCFAIHLVSRGSIDQRVVKILGKKMALFESVLGKRIKGEGDITEVSRENDISDLAELFNGLVSDARAFRERSTKL